MIQRMAQHLIWCEDSDTLLYIIFEFYSKEFRNKNRCDVRKYDHKIVGMVE